jgi:hypothetical protein
MKHHLAALSLLTLALTACPGGSGNPSYQSPEVKITGQYSLERQSILGVRANQTLKFDVSVDVLPYERPIDGLQSINPKDIIGKDSKYKVYGFVNSSSSDSAPYPYLGPLDEAKHDPAKFPADQMFEFIGLKRNTDGSLVPLEASYNATTNRVSVRYEVKMPALSSAIPNCTEIMCSSTIGFGFMFLPKDADPNDWQKARRFIPQTRSFEVTVF